MSTGESQPPASAPSEVGVDVRARSQSRVALITAVVALVSALLGPLVSLKINSDQIESQGNQASKQIASNTKQSESEFVRTQRSTAYTDFLTAFNNGTLDLLGAGGAFGTPGNSPQALAGQAGVAVQAVKDVTATYYKVRIVASERANTKAQALYAEFAGWSGALLVVGNKVATGQPLTDEDRQLLASSESEYAVLLDLSIAFIDTSRGDVSANDEKPTSS